jgi:hypothetical protein
MSANGLGITESTVHAPIGRQAAYSYRTGMGMIPSAEFTVFFDDFIQKTTSNIPAGWEGVIVDTAAAVAQYGTLVAGSQGVLQLLDATASEGAAIYLPKGFQLTSGKKFIMEARVRTNDVTDNNFVIGLSDLTSTTNPEDLYSTASDNLVAFGLGDGDSNPKMLSDKANSGTTYQTQTARTMLVDTWHVLGIEFDGTKLRGFLDGKLCLMWSGAATTIPTGVQLAPFISAVNGNGAGGNINLVDYFRIMAER